MLVDLDPVVLGRRFVLNWAHFQIIGLEDCRDIDGVPSAPSVVGFEGVTRSFRT